MSLSALTAVAEPPEVPRFTGNREQWLLVEREIGVTLPADYKGLIDCYGSGCFAGYICPYNPFSEQRDLISIGRGILGLYRERQQRFPQYHPTFPCFPEPGGLLPWGRDDNAGTLFWITEGLPDHWPLILMDSHFSETYCRYDMNVTAFLAGWLRGTIRPAFYPEDIFPVEGHPFAPMPW